MREQAEVRLQFPGLISEIAEALRPRRRMAILAVSAAFGSQLSAQGWSLADYFALGLPAQEVGLAKSLDGRPEEIGAPDGLISGQPPRLRGGRPVWVGPRTVHLRLTGQVVVVVIVFLRPSS